jgi:hypothetical protein
VPWGVRQLMLLFMKSSVKGAATSIYCAASPHVADQSGRYYTDCRAEAPSGLASDAALAEELYEKSRRWVDLEPMP